MKYKIINTATWKGLEKEVNKLIQEGWIPQGGAISGYQGCCI